MTTRNGPSTPRGELSSASRALATSLDLRPHPEGGFYREWYRSPSVVAPVDGRKRRAAMTAIYYLLPEGRRSRWHLLRSDEAWTFLQGAPLELLVVEEGRTEVRRHRLHHHGAGGGTEPSVIVPASAWQAARPVGGDALVVCTVAPGFDFDDFHLLSGDLDAEARLRAIDPDLAAFL